MHSYSARRRYARLMSSKRRGRRVGSRSYVSKVRKTRKSRSYPRRYTSKRKMLNVTSRKKRDTMLAYTNITSAAPGGSATYNTGPAVFNGNQTYTILWCPTFRDLSNASGGANIVINRSERTATTCYMRGLAENVRVQTTDGLPWTWRRICFTIKGSFLNDATNSTRQLTIETAPGGYRRLLTPWQTDAVTPSLVFQGTANLDWNDALTAPTDSTRISVKYDQTRILSAGNEQGMNRVFKLWHPMNKNLVYNDEEAGDAENAGGLSTLGKQGMGDYYVYDIIVPRLNGTTASQMSFQPESTLYWHEK